MALENQASSDRAGYRIPGADHRKWPCRSRSRAVVHLLRGWSGHLLEVNLAWTGLMPSLVVAAGRAKMVLATGAQAFGSAQSYALKQFMRAMFMISTGEKDDPDFQATQDVGPVPPQSMSVRRFIKSRFKL